ncbi:MAG: cysteine peptidase family C39 domain-containing protein [Chloroflexota bacterium]
MPKILLPVPHFTQHQQADCLAACAAMVLDYWKRPFAYKSLLKLLNIGPYGAPSSNIVNLTKQVISVAYQEGTIDEIELALAANKPAIAFVYTGELSIGMKQQAMPLLWLVWMKVLST